MRNYAKDHQPLHTSAALPGLGADTSNSHVDGSGKGRHASLITAATVCQADDLYAPSYASHGEVLTLSWHQARQKQGWPCKPLRIWADTVTLYA